MMKWSSEECVEPALVDPIPAVSTERGVILAAYFRNCDFPVPGSPTSNRWDSPTQSAYFESEQFRFIHKSNTLFKHTSELFPHDKPKCQTAHYVDCEHIPLTLVPDASILCTPPAKTIATASLTTYMPNTWGQRLIKISFLPSKCQERERMRDYMIYNPHWIPWAVPHYE